MAAIIITVIAAFLSNFAENRFVLNAFAGIRVCVSVLIANSAWKIAKRAVVDKPAFLIFLAVFAASVLLDLTPAIYVVLAALAGLLIKGLEVKAK